MKPGFVSSPTTWFTKCPGTSFTLPRERNERGSVKDVRRPFVKDVMRLNTGFGLGGAILPETPEESFAFFHSLPQAKSIFV